MPSWKKLLVSGSDATLNSLQVSNNVTAAAFSGSFSGSFQGDGSGLTGIPSEVEVTKKFTFQFTSQNSLTLNHQLDSEYPFVQVYDNDKEIIVPLTVESLGKNSIRVDFSENRSGFVIIAKGGYLVSDFTQEFTNVSTVNVSHLFNEDLPFVQVFGTDNQVFIPETVKVLDNNTVRVDFSNNSSGFVAISKGGYTIFDLINAGSIEEFTNQSSITLSCSSVSEFPFIQVYESGSNEQIIPLGITKVDNSTVVITFSETYDGFISFPRTGHVIDNTSKLEGEPGSYYLDFNNFTNIPPFSPFPFTGSAIISGSLDVIGPLTATTFVGVVSSSAQIQLNQITGTTFDNANFTFPQELTVQGKLTAREFHTELISSSIIYESGSTKFGDSFDDTHEFTGSVLITGSAFITGSFEVHGTTILTGNITASGNFVPRANELFDLGSPDLRWKDLYLSGSTIFLGATKLTTNESGDVEFKDVETNSLRKIRVEELEIGTGENRRNIKVDESGNIKFMDSLNSDRTLQGLGLSNAITTENIAQHINSTSLTTFQLLNQVSGSVLVDLDLGPMIDITLNGNIELSFTSSIAQDQFRDFTLIVRGLNEFDLSTNGISLEPPGGVSSSTKERNVIKGQFLGNGTVFYNDIRKLEDSEEIYADSEYVVGGYY